MTTTQRSNPTEPTNKRLELLEQLLDELELGGGAPKLDEGQWQSLSCMIVDASLTNDDETLKAAYEGLYWICGTLRGLDNPDTQQAADMNRAHGMLNLTRWHLRRSVSSAVPAYAPGNSLIARLLQAIAARPGSRNRDLMDCVDIDEIQLSRLGRRLQGGGMAMSLPTGQENAWYVTPRGLSCLSRLGLEPSTATES